MENLSNGSTKVNTVDFSQYEDAGFAKKVIQLNMIHLGLECDIIKVQIVTREYGEDSLNQRQQRVVLYDGTQYNHYTAVKGVSDHSKKKNKSENPLSYQNQNIQIQALASNSLSDGQKKSVFQHKTYKIAKTKQYMNNKNLKKKVQKSQLKNRLNYLNQLQKTYQRKNIDNFKSQNISTHMAIRNSKNKK